MVWIFSGPVTVTTGFEHGNNGVDGRPGIDLEWPDSCLELVGRDSERPPVHLVGVATGLEQGARSGHEDLWCHVRLRTGQGVGIFVWNKKDFLY